MLSYYSKELKEFHNPPDNLRGETLNVMELTGITWLKSKGHEFQIYTPTKLWHLYVDSAHQLVTWIKSLAMVRQGVIKTPSEIPNLRVCKKKGRHCHTAEHLFSLLELT
eukprot:TRINITY_DN15992_c0_g1_i2.p1 TRINITY_DN15992_c0_g1~~TRINITY_DN15992_c0_g1_i2.p1  ORF type:complete len:109 (-),score=5.14 TRINITY_DN15992_c0_g1_i2:104-430(-)